MRRPVQTGKQPLLILLAVILSALPLTAAEPDHSAWETLSPLPDPIGFAGMFAGQSLDGLFAGGGSQFLEAPPWRGGHKVFSDRVFVLESPSGSWRELPDRLPFPIALAAGTPFEHEVLCVGGMNATGALRSALRIRIDDGKLRITHLPNLPHPLACAATAVVNGVLYVTGGITDPASTEPLTEFWAISLLSSGDQPPEWKRLPDFPGKPVIIPSAASDGHFFYVFGGMHYQKSSNDKVEPLPQKTAYRFDPRDNTWSQLSDLPSPRVGAASPAPRLPDGRVLIAGGYGTVFSGALEDHPGFEAETFYYAPAEDKWAQAPSLPVQRVSHPDSLTSPGPEPMIVAPTVLWKNKVVLISGEVRPAIRTPAVLGLPLESISSAANATPIQSSSGM